MAKWYGRVMSQTSEKPLNRLGSAVSTRRLPALAALATLCLVLAIGCGGGGGDAIVRVEGPVNVIAFGAQDGERHGLYLVRPDGSGLRALTAEEAVVSFPVWSPAGGRIAYYAGATEPQLTGALRIYDFATESVITVSDRALISALGPAMSWSGDGGRLAFADVEGQIRIYDADSGKLLDGAVVSSSVMVAWSPIRDELAVSRQGGASLGDLYAVQPDGGGLRPLLQRQGDDTAPVWSPDGELLVFSSAPPNTEQERQQLLILDPETGALTELGQGFGAAWSPDGERLAYSGQAGDSAAQNQDIFIVAAGGGEPQAISSAVTRDLWPSWSADGERVVYLAQVDRTTAFLCVVRLQPEERDCLDLPGLLPSAPAWSPR